MKTKERMMLTFCSMIVLLAIECDKLKYKIVIDLINTNDCVIQVTYIY